MSHEDDVGDHVGDTLSSIPGITSRGFLKKCIHFLKNWKKIMCTVQLTKIIFNFNKTVTRGRPGSRPRQVPGFTVFIPAPAKSEKVAGIFSQFLVNFWSIVSKFFKKIITFPWHVIADCSKIHYFLIVQDLMTKRV